MALYHIFFPYLLAPTKDLKKLAGADWAVVTGSTDGIGKAYAFELAKKQFNLVLISRTQSKLDETAKEIKDKYHVQVKTIAFDFTNTNVKDYKNIVLQELDTVDVGILINNVGLSYEYPERIDRIDGSLQRVADITIVNTLPATILSTAVLEKMSNRGNGVVVNMSSSAGYHTLRYWAIYSATKRYVSHLSAILRKEFAGKNIIIQTVCPMMIATKMSKVRRTSAFIPSAEQFACSAVRSIGLVEETTGCLMHQLERTVVFSLLPKFLLDYVANSNSMVTRRRALAKKSNAQKTD